jgi:hypothetical protein
MASDATNVFAFEDDYSMGILSSSVHVAWAWSRSSTLKGDIRYTPSTVFASFAWPDPSDDQRDQIANASRNMIGRRQAICAENDFGLTELYNLVDEGAYDEIKRLRWHLDEAVAQAYGWPKVVAQESDEIVRRLREINQEIATGTRVYGPFSTPAGAPMQLLLSDAPLDT